MIRNLLYIVLVICSSTVLFAQVDNDENPISTDLVLSDSYLNGFYPAITDPPEIPLRTMAEWEEIETLVIVWEITNETPLNIYRDIVQYAQEECSVLIISNDTLETISQLGELYTDAVELIEGDYDSFWIRDFGATTTYFNDVDSLAFIDYKYNRANDRPKDDSIPGLMADHLRIPLYGMIEPPYTLVNTGGNIMTDGLGRAFSSTHVLDNNGENNNQNVDPLTEAEIDSIMFEFMGIEQYIKIPSLEFDVIHHLDMHMKLLDEKTLLYGYIPEGYQTDSLRLEQNLDSLLDLYQNQLEINLDVIRIPMPPDQDNAFPGQPSNNSSIEYPSYVNAVFLNKTILVPSYGYQTWTTDWDALAIEVWEKAMPGYTIHQIDCSSMPKTVGALHCMTKEVGVADPLWISHIELDDQDIGLSEYFIEATIKHRSGIEEAILHYRTNSNESFQEMSPTTSNIEQTKFYWELEQLPEGTIVEYYFEASSNSGKQQVRPLVAPDGYFSFKVKRTTNTKSVEHTELLPIFPNPTSSEICIPVFSKQKVPVSIELRDLLGRKIYTIFEGRLPIGASKYYFDTSPYSSGVYFVSIQSGNGNLAQKLIIK